ncbi:MAG: Hsp20/alpha crystallin family protein [Planctomycetia bacterium]|nr:Hsp20/alpha crystallin family protein [Planctomycetia bacterium]
MSLIPWKGKHHGNGGRALAPFDAFRHEMDRLFDSFFHDPFAVMESSFGQMGGWTPTLDVSETEKEITVRAEIPGVKPEDLEVTVTGDTLVVAGEKKESSETKEKGYWHSESRFGSFRRQVRLPAEVDSEAVDADYANGVLTIRLKKVETAQAKRITVKAT